LRVRTSVLPGRRNDATGAPRSARPLLLLRADADAAIGSGHVARCLALGQQWPFAVVLACRDLAKPLAGMAKRSGATIARVTAPAGSPADANSTAAIAHDVGARWIVVDGPQFTAAYRTRLKARCSARVVWLDDGGTTRAIAAEAVVNPNLNATAAMYPRNRGSQLMLGTRYALLRQEFRRARRARVRSTTRRVLLTLGGSDSDGATRAVLAALGQSRGAPLHIRVLAPVGAVGIEPLFDIAEHSPHRIDIRPAAATMVPHLRWADVCLIAAGGTLWEALRVGAPVLTFVRTPLQHRIVRQLVRMEAVGELGFLARLDQRRVCVSVRQLLSAPAIRRRMSRIGPRIVDGRGAGRVVDELLRQT
jgi:UDP-2,4-diacetamido-2,4,6-trideoxy-beta-L-altropyranose hydrolase